MSNVFGHLSYLILRLCYMQIEWTIGVSKSTRKELPFGARQKFLAQTVQKRQKIDVSHTFSACAQNDSRSSISSHVSIQIIFLAPFSMAQTYLHRVMPIKKDISQLSKEKIISIGFCHEKLSFTTFAIENAPPSSHDNLLQNFRF